MKALPSATRANSALFWTAHVKQQVYLPDEDDDRGSLGHGSNHAAHTDDTQEGEEGLLTAWTGTFSWQSHSVLTAAGYTRTAGQVLAQRQEITSNLVIPQNLHVNMYI